MEILSNKNGEKNIIAMKLKEISPHTIAVAYVGKNWKEYCSDFKELIFSPTQGTCKDAILAIVKEKGIKNVYPLDNLHSKIYLGHDHAFVGSSNLSDNAHSESGLLETGVLISELNDKFGFEALQPIIENYKEISRIYYPTEKSKCDAIEAIPNSSNKKINRNSAPDFLNYDIKKPRFNIILAWYLPEKEVGECKIKKIENFDENVNEWNNFLESDSIKVGDRILCWEFDEDENSKPKPGKAFIWLTVSHIESEAIKGQGKYSKIAFQSDEFANAPKPFKLTKQVKNCFIEVMRNGKFKDFYEEVAGKSDIGSDKVWSIPSPERTKEFLSTWQNEVKKASEMSK